jgi:hypothetical protein
MRRRKAVEMLSRELHGGFPSVISFMSLQVNDLAPIALPWLGPLIRGLATPILFSLRS